MVPGDWTFAEVATTSIRKVPEKVNCGWGDERNSFTKVKLLNTVSPHGMISTEARSIYG